MRFFVLAHIILLSLLVSSCGFIIEKKTNLAAQRLSDTFLNYEDPATVASAMPTFLILIDSMANTVDASPQSQLSAAKMYGSYSGAFVTDIKRQKILTEKALWYAQEASCKTDGRWCKLEAKSSDEFTAFINTLTANDTALAYAYASAQLGFIQSHSDDWGVIANLSRATQLLEVVVKHDASYDNAGAHLYLAAIATTLPPALGGKPDVGKTHFERGIELTQGRNLVIKVEYARRYARMVFDKELHHQLLTEVLAAQAKQPGLTLMNTWAQQQAQLLLDDENNYFD